MPIANDDLLGLLISLTSDSNEEVRQATATTLSTLDPLAFSELAKQAESSSDVLGFLCLWQRAPRELVEAAIFNPSTPDSALVQLAARSSDSKLIEAISLKQQSLIRSPEIIEAIISNPAHSAEAERRAREVREEFFEKQFGARIIADETRARDDAARQAEASARDTFSISGVEDLIRLGLIEEGIDDRLILEYEEEYGPFTAEQPSYEEQLDIERAVDEASVDDAEVTIDRVPVFQRVALMSVKDRVMLGIKGTREARMILVRDPNRIVAGAVLKNPRLTDAEIETIASLKSVPEDVLRRIGMNRQWARSYIVIHNLVKNPRTPIATSLGFINRLQTRDLRVLSQNKNVPDVVRQTSYRLYVKRNSA